MGVILIQEDPTCCRATKLLHPATQAPTLRAPAPQQEKSQQRGAQASSMSRPCLLQLQKGHKQHWRPSAAEKENKKIKIWKRNKHKKNKIKKGWREMSISWRDTWGLKSYLKMGRFTIYLYADGNNSIRGKWVIQMMERRTVVQAPRARRQDRLSQKHRQFVHPQEVERRQDVWWREIMEVLLWWLSFPQQSKNQNYLLHEDGRRVGAFRAEETIWNSPSLAKGGILYILGSF